MKNKKIILTLGVLLACGVVFMLRSCKPAQVVNEKSVMSGEKPAVRVLLQINLSTEAVIFSGFPIIAEIDSIPTISETQPEFEVLDVTQEKKTWDWKQDANQKTWLISAESVEKIEPGYYKVRVLLKDQGKKFRSNFVHLQIKKDEPTDEEKRRGQFMAALYFGLKGEDEKALSVIDSLTQIQRPSLVFEMKGSLLERMGRTSDALKAYEQALTAYKGEIAPAALVQKKRELWRKASEEFRKANPDYKPALPVSRQKV